MSAKLSQSCVSGLIKDQFPDYAQFAVSSVPIAGSDNTLFRLGDRYSVRFPNSSKSELGLEKECQWLPRLKPNLTLEISIPIEKGKPTTDFPHVWAIYNWLNGGVDVQRGIEDSSSSAKMLGEFLCQLKSINAEGGPPPGVHNFNRGVDLEMRDENTRNCLRCLEDPEKITHALRIWENSLAQDKWEESDTWIHGDLHAGNVLQENGEITGIIDFGGLGVGDPACDIMAAWTLFTGAARQNFQESVQVDQATWERGRGWALSFGLIAYDYYRNTDSSLADISLRTLQNVLDERV